MKNDNSLDKFVEKYPTYIEALDIIDDLKKQLERHNKYFNSFSCDSFDEFVDFISTFMLTPHEEQTLIKDLKKQLEEKEKIEYTDTINFVETSEPDIVAKELDRLNEQLAESEKQRQHLKDWLDDEILTSVDNESYYATINEYEEEVKKLKQQLAESISLSLSCSQ